MKIRLLFLVLALTLSACGSPPPKVNLALYQKATASRQLPSAQTWLSLDGETGSGWSPGADLPQWIEIDLGAPATISSIRLLVNQPGGGISHHILYLARENHSFRQVAEFNEEFHTGDWLIYAPNQSLTGVRYVKVETLEGANWVGWLEIQVWGRP